MAREQYKAVYRLHTVAVGHRMSDIKQKWENSKRRKKVIQELSLGAHTYLLTYLLTCTALYRRRGAHA